jgi:hypothetical protein
MVLLAVAIHTIVIATYTMAALAWPGCQVRLAVIEPVSWPSFA